MINIVICSQKGGVGKTLIADELMYSLERTNTTFNFYDLDSQGSARHQPSDASADDNAAVAVVDMPGHLIKGADGPSTVDYIQEADVLVVPFIAGVSDQHPLERFLALIAKTVPETPLILVQDRWTRFRLNSMFTEWLEGDILPTLNAQLVTLSQSEQYGMAHAGGESVIVYAPETTAAQSMMHVINVIREAAGLPAETALTKILNKVKKRPKRSGEEVDANG